MQFIDPQNKTTAVLSNGTVTVVLPGNKDVATIQLDNLGNCADDAFQQFPKPFTLLIKDSAGVLKFQIGMGF